MYIFKFICKIINEEPNFPIVKIGLKKIHQNSGNRPSAQNTSEYPHLFFAKIPWINIKVQTRILYTMVQLTFCLLNIFILKILNNFPNRESTPPTQKVLRKC